MKNAPSSFAIARPDQGCEQTRIEYIPELPVSMHTQIGEEVQGRIADDTFFYGMPGAIMRGQAAEDLLKVTLRPVDIIFLAVAE
jgi:hypothetical protein